MRKLFTCLGAAMLLAGAAFSANAQAPTFSVDYPYDNEMTNSLGQVYGSWSESVSFINPYEYEAEGFFGSVNTYQARNVSMSFGDITSDEIPMYENYGYYYIETKAFAELTNEEFGVYTITIPAGVVQTASGVQNAEYKYTFTLNGKIYSDESIRYGQTYAPDELKAVTITFDQAPLTVNTDAGNIEYGDPNDPDGSVEVLPSKYINQNLEAGIVTLDLSWLPNGSYVVMIPAGYYSKGEYATSNLVELRFNVFEGLPAAEIIEAPSLGYNWAQDYIVTELPNLTFTWGQAVTETNPVAYIKMGWNPEYAETVATIPATGFVKNGNNYSINLQSYCKDLEDGTYYVTIPEGIVNADGLINPAQTLATFNLVSIYPGAAEWTAPTVDDSNVYVAWEGANWVSFSEAAYDYLTVNLSDENGKVVYTYGSYDNASESYMEFDPEFRVIGRIFHLENLYDEDGNPVTIPSGKYTISIPQGFFNIQNEEQYNEDTYSPNAATSFTFTYTTNPLPEGTVVSPTNIYSSFLGNVTFSWEGNNIAAGNMSGTLYYYASDDANAVLIPVTEENMYLIYDSGEEGGVAPMAEGDEEYNLLVVDCAAAASAAETGYGRYVLVLNSGCVVNADDEYAGSSEISFTFYIYPTDTYNVSYDFTEVNGKVTSVTATWNNASLALNETASEILVVDNNDRYLVSGVLNAAGNALEITMPTQLLGDFTIILPEAYVIIAGNAINAEEYIDYGTLTGVGSINAAEGYYNVYDLQGRNVLNSADAIAVKNLAPGLYIINGRKVVVK